MICTSTQSPKSKRVFIFSHGALRLMAWQNNEQISSSWFKLTHRCHYTWHPLEIDLGQRDSFLFWKGRKRWLEWDSPASIRDHSKWRSKQEGRGTVLPGNWQGKISSSDKDKGSYLQLALHHTEQSFELLLEPWKTVTGPTSILRPHLSLTPLV